MIPIPSAPSLFLPLRVGAAEATVEKETPEVTRYEGKGCGRRGENDAQPCNKRHAVSTLIAPMKGEDCHKFLDDVKEQMSGLADRCLIFVKT